MADLLSVVIGLLVVVCLGGWFVAWDSIRYQMLCPDVIYLCSNVTHPARIRVKGADNPTEAKTWIVLDGVEYHTVLQNGEERYLDIALGSPGHVVVQQATQPPYKAIVFMYTLCLDYTFDRSRWRCGDTGQIYPGIYTWPPSCNSDGVCVPDAVVAVRVTDDHRLYEIHKSKFV
jgi:hypothetical protein